MKISSALVFALLAFATAEARWCKHRRNREAKPFQVEGQCPKGYVETTPAEARWCKNRRNREAKPFQVEGQCPKGYVETTPVESKPNFI